MSVDSTSPAAPPLKSILKHSHSNSMIEQLFYAINTSTSATTAANAITSESTNDSYLSTNNNDNNTNIIFSHANETVNSNLNQNSLAICEPIEQTCTTTSSLIKNEQDLASNNICASQNECINQPVKEKSNLSEKPSTLMTNSKLTPHHSHNSNPITSVAANVDLPAYWEARVDNLGRVFYIDHLNRTTTWKRPKLNSNQSSQEIATQRLLNSELEKQRLDKRYQSIRRTINQTPTQAPTADCSMLSLTKAKSSLSSLNSSQNSPVLTGSSQDTPENESAASGNNSASTSIEASAQSSDSAQATCSSASIPLLNDSLLSQPGAQFILRSDLHHIVKQNPEAKELIKSSQNLIGIIQKVRNNPAFYYKKYQHNKELVKFLNMFADPVQPLPVGWEKKLEKSSKVFFVDHNSRSTTFIDPRLPLPQATSSILNSDPACNQVFSSSNSPSCLHITTITHITPPSTLTRPSSSKFNDSETTASPLPLPSTLVSSITNENPVQDTVGLASTSNGYQQLYSTQNQLKSLQPTVKAIERREGPPLPPSFPPPPPPLLPPTLPPPLLPAPPPISTSTSSSAQSISAPAVSSVSKIFSSSNSQRVQPAPVSYSDRVVSFLQQSNIFELIKRHNIVLSNKQKEKLTLIRQGGRPVYDRMSADIDLASVISQLEDLIMCFVVVSNTSNNTSQLNGLINNDTNINHSNPPQGAASTTSMVPSTSSSSNSSSALNLNRNSTSNNNNRRDYQRGFHVKLRNFYRKLESKGYGQGPQKSKILIRRDKLLEDAKNKFMQLSKHDLRKNKIFICFQGEEGLDYGGPAREFFFLLSRELFNPYYGLFEYSASDMYTVQISPMSAFQEHALEWFQFAGRVLGIALIHQYLLDAFFTRPFYKALLRDTNWTLSDLETLDPEYCQSLIWMKENDITDVLDLTFSVTEDKYGQLIERDLRENGRHIAVTEKNKHEYIQRLIKWRVERGVQQQTEALVKGFYEVVDSKQVHVFDARELELVLCGTIEIDLNDWKKNTDYRSGYHSTHQVIIWFWVAVDKFDNEQKLKLLQFVTGTSSIPYEGFAALRGSNGLRKFCIERWGTVDALPRAHTCFNRLDLPAYPTFEILYDKLILAIEETSGFCIQ